MKVNVGHKPYSAGMRLMLSHAVRQHFQDWTSVVVVHHYTDNSDKLQLEVERRHQDGTITFERLIFK